MKNIEKYFDELKTVKKQEIETDSSFLKIKKYNCLLNNGKVIRREKILKNNKDGSAAIIFPITINKKVLLAIEPRVFTKRTVDIGLPSGYIEENESPIDAAKRELLEETGYEAKKLISLGSFYQDQGCSSAFNHYFLAFDCKKVGNQKLDEGEFIKFIEVDFDKLEYLIENGYMTGLNSAYAIEKSKNYIKEMKL